MQYYSISFFVIAIAYGVYALSELTSGAALTGTSLFSVFLVIALGCVIFDYFDDA